MSAGVRLTSTVAGRRSCWLVREYPRSTPGDLPVGHVAGTSVPSMRTPGTELVRGRWGRSREGGSPREPLAADGVAVFECCAASTRHPVCTEGQRIAAPSRCPIFGSEMEADLSVHPRSVRPCPSYAQERQPVGVVSTGMSTSRAVAWPVRSAGQPVTMPRRGLAVPGATGCWLAARGSLPWLGSRSQDRR